MDDHLPKNLSEWKSSADPEGHSVEDEYERGLRELARRIPVVMFAQTEYPDGGTRYHYVSPSIEQVLGIRPEDLYKDARALLSRVVPEEASGFQDAILRARRTMTASEHVGRMLNARGEPRWIYDWFKPKAEPDGTIHWTGYFIDVHDQVEARRALEQAEQRIRDITESLPGVVYETQYHPKTGSRTAYVTDGALALYGVSREQILADNTALTRLIPLEDRARLLKEFQRSFSQHGPMTQDFRILKPDGELRWLRTHSARREGEGGAMRWIGHTVDVTDEKRVEQELAKAKLAAEDASRAKSEFLANMSHEIRTPMNAILSFAYLGLRADPPPKLREYFARIESSAKTLLDLINDVLDLSKVEAGKLELERAPFELSQVLDNLESVIGLRAQEKGLAFRVEVDARVPRGLVGDALRLGQVLLNLGGNAVKFTQDGAVLVDVRLASAPQDGEVALEFSVRDTGIGLKPEQAQRLFQPFVQADSSTAREFGGTGLGLSICKRLVELMGGDIGVQSEPGVGSTFRFTARLGLAQGNTAKREANADGRELRGLSVLVTDDHDINRQVVRELLDSVGVVVTLAASGQEAIEAVRAQRFDAIFMDMRMPGMDGLEATRRIRALEPSSGEGARRTPIIALTANVMAPDRERCLTAGMDDFVGKPIAVSELFAALARWSGRVQEVVAESSVPRVPRVEAEPPEHDFAAAGARFGHKREIWDALAQDFLGGQNLLERLRTELAAGRLDAAGTAAHTLKGFAAQVGALRVSRQAARIEAALDAKRPEEVDTMELERALLSAREALRQYRARAPETVASAARLDRVQPLAAQLVKCLEADDDRAWDAYEQLREVLPDAEREAIAPVGRLIANLDHAEALELWRRLHPADREGRD